MSTLLVGYAFRLGLDPAKKLVLMALCDCANDRGGSCFPAVGTLARKASISVRQTQRVLADLRQGGWIEIEANHAGGRHTRRYAINVDVLRAAAELDTSRDDKLAPLANRPSGAANRHPCGDTSRHRRGATGVTAGVTPVAPELLLDPSVDPSNTTTTVDVLAWPPAMDRATRVVVVDRYFGALSQCAAQDVLDELAGLSSIGRPPTKLMGWLRECAARAQRGEFVLDAGIPVKQARVRAAADAAAADIRRAEDAAAAARRNDPEARARADAACHAAAETLGLRPRIPAPRSPPDA